MSLRLGAIWLLAVSVLLGILVLGVSTAYADCQPNYAQTCADPLETCRKVDESYQCVCRWGYLHAGWKILPVPVPAGERLDICMVIRHFGGAEASFGELVDVIAAMITVLVVMVGLISIVIGGYIYMTAGGSADRVQKAKTWIGSALLGIALALLAWIILYTISPLLV